MDAAAIKDLLKLKPLTFEGGYYAETYRSQDMLNADILEGRYGAPRHAATAIYYLLEPGTFSEMHRVASDEVFHFYLGDAVEMLQLWPDGTVRRVMIGNDLERGISPQVVVPRGVWQGTRLTEGGRFALLGCTVSPGFEYADYESGKRDALSDQYPEARETIAKLTRE